MRLPPRWVRRLLLSPLPPIALVTYVAGVPLLLIVAFVLSYRLPGKWRALRTLGLATVYLAVETLVVIVSFALWVVSGFGWRIGSPFFVSAHYSLLRLALRMLVGAGRRLFSLQIQADSPDLPVVEEPARDGSPLVVLARHAGPADSVLLLHEVMSWQGRRPRIVAKDVLQLDPAFDILLNRLPNRFISSSGGGGAIEAIADLAAGMQAEDALVIFPEGGNFTESRRVRAIDRLRTNGHVAAAERAAALRNVLPPRPAGTKAALGAAPTADVVFVAHTGLDDIGSLADLWFALPQDNVLLMRWHVVESELVPRDEGGQEDMLYRAWDAIDSWIERQREGVQTADDQRHRTVIS